MYGDIQKSPQAAWGQTPQVATTSMGSGLGNQLAPQSGVPSAFTSVDQTAEMVMQAAMALRDRLDSGGALRPSGPNGVGDSAKMPQESVSGIAGRLRDHNKQLNVAREVLVAALNRLDL